MVGYAGIREILTSSWSGVSSSNSPFGSMVESFGRRVHSGAHYARVLPDATYPYLRRYESLAGIHDDWQYLVEDKKQPCQDDNPPSGFASSTTKD